MKQKVSSGFGMAWPLFVSNEEMAGWYDPSRKHAAAIGW
jgi:hypothetical protein